MWGGRGAAQCERRARLRSSSVGSRSARNGGCRAVDTAISWDRKAIPWTGGPHRGFVKRESAARASADRKRCGFDRLRLRPGRSTRYTVGGRCSYTGATRGGRQWRSQPRRPLNAHLCGGAEDGAAAATKSYRFSCGSGSVMVIRKQVSYLEEDWGSSGIRFASRD